jgi:enamine deaminase RidA (YjgF/YER057c/UK114 family)
VARWDLTGSNRPSDRRCAELWNGPANQTNRSLVRGRSFPLATVRGVEPNKAGQPGCGVLLGERQDGPWLSFGAVLTETAVFWDGGVTGVRYGTDSPTGDVDDAASATLQADGTLTSATASRPGAAAPSMRACQRGWRRLGRASPHPPAGTVTARSEQQSSSPAVPAPCHTEHDATGSPRSTTDTPGHLTWVPSTTGMGQHEWQGEGLRGTLTASTTSRRHPPAPYCITVSRNRRDGMRRMTAPTPPDLPANARFINPQTMHQPSGYSHVVEVTEGRPVYIAGQVALDPTGALVGPGDIRAQARQVFQNLRAALEAVGVGFEQVVKLNYYLVDARQLPVVREVRDEFINTHQPPASTAVEVRRLVRDDLLIEVDAVASSGSFQLLSQG